MAKRRKPKTPLQPLLIVDDRNQPDEAWIPASQLPPDKHYGLSDRMLVCRGLEPGQIWPDMFLSSYDFHRKQWRTAMGELENVTHWQPLPDMPKEHM